jgi:hypothetical protein
MGDPSWQPRLLVNSDPFESGMRVESERPGRDIEVEEGLTPSLRHT